MTQFQPTKAMADVFAERQRQIEVEGWTAEHDDTHDEGDLACAGASYAINAADQLNPYSCGDGDNAVPLPWPMNWSDEWWKPKDPRRDLVRAAALIIAEIDRIDRQSERNEA